MRKMIIALAVIAMASSSYGATGWFNDYVVASVDGGADQFLWLDTDPSFGTEFNGSDLGTLTALTIGADFRYWSDDQDRTGGSMFVSIDGGVAAEYAWTQTGPAGNDYQGTFVSSTVDVAGGLSDGAHTLTVWAQHDGSNQGQNFLNDGGNNYSATFTVVPEPATIALFGLGLGGLMVSRRRRA